MMSASKQAKAYGLPSLNYVANITGFDRSTLHGWSKNRPILFDIILKGCQARALGNTHVERVKAHCDNIMNEVNNKCGR